MSDEELHRLVEHLAHIHGVSPREVVSEVTGEPPVGYEFADEPEEALDSDGDEPAGEAASETARGEKRARKRRGKAHWAAWGLAMVVMGVLVGAVVIAFLKFVSGPAQASITPAQAGIPSSTPPPATASTDRLVGITFELTFPHQFDQVENVAPDPGVTEEYRVGSKTDYKRLIAVSVRPTTDPDINDDSDLKLRELQSDVYQQTQRKVAGETVTIMTKSGGGEQTMFWLHQGKLLTIAITSTDPVDNVADFMNQVLANIEWKT